MASYSTLLSSILLLCIAVIAYANNDNTPSPHEEKPAKGADPKAHTNHTRNEEVSSDKNNSSRWKFRRFYDPTTHAFIIERKDGDEWKPLQPVSPQPNEMSAHNSTGIECEYSQDGVNWARLKSQINKYRYRPKVVQPGRQGKPQPHNMNSNTTNVTIFEDMGPGRATYHFGKNDSWFRPPANYTYEGHVFKKQPRNGTFVRRKATYEYRRVPLQPSKTGQVGNGTNVLGNGREYGRRRWYRPYSGNRWSQPYGARPPYINPYYNGGRYYDQRYYGAYPQRRYRPDMYDYRPRKLNWRYPNVNDGSRYYHGYGNGRYDQQQGYSYGGSRYYQSHGYNQDPATYGRPYNPVHGGTYDGRTYSPAYRGTHDERGGYDHGRGGTYDGRTDSQGHRSMYDERRGYDRDRVSTYDDRRYDQGYGGRATYDGRRNDQGYGQGYVERREVDQRNDWREERRSN